MDSQQATSTFFELAKEYGIFAALFIALLIGVVYLFWTLFKKFISTTDKVVETNSQFVKELDQLQELFKNMQQVNENIFNQLDFIKKNVYKQNSCVTDSINVLKDITQDEKIHYRLDNIIKEIQRPVS